MVESALIVVDKPGGITSHQVVARARRALRTKKVGHAGTLDPMATGVLLLGVEKGTRLLGHLSLTTKTYEATIRLGQATNTDDADGEAIASPGATLAALEPHLPSALDALRGTIRQVPSTVSAIKVDGRRAYALARRGEEVRLAAREVTVSRLEVTDARAAHADAGGDPDGLDGLDVVDLDVVVDCTTGTYVRALARDLGATLGVGGHLTALRRTRVGPFTLAQAGWDGHLGRLAPGELLDLQPLALADMARACFPVVEVDEASARDVGFGRRLALDIKGDPTAVLHDGRLLALYRPDAGGAAPVAVLV